MEELYFLERRRQVFRPFKKRVKKTELDKEIEAVLEEMFYQSRYSDNYLRNLEHLERLYSIKGTAESTKKRISPDTIAIVVGNLLGIILILHYEKFNTVTTRAVNFILRGRV